MSVQITSPDAGEEDYPVYVPAGSGPSGFMCAKATATQDHFANESKSVTTFSAPQASHVYAKVYDGHNPSRTDIPMTHPASDATVKEGVHEGNDEWCIDSVPCPSTGLSPGAPHTLAVWAEFPGGTGGPIERRALQLFFAICVDSINCNCQPAPDDDEKSRQKKARINHGLLALAPIVWEVVSVGFRASSAVCNGSWTLALHDTPNGHCVWGNRGDGTSTPSVELSCERPLPKTWTLTFRLGNHSVVEYTRSASNWNPLGENVLHRSSSERADSDAPETITITPG